MADKMNVILLSAVATMSEKDLLPAFHPPIANIVFSPLVLFFRPLNFSYLHDNHYFAIFCVKLPEKIHFFFYLQKLAYVFT